jgi:hypothetical protein
MINLFRESALLESLEKIFFLNRELKIVIIITVIIECSIEKFIKWPLNFSQH